MAKIGLLCLNKGRYGNKQIVSSKWIDEMTRPRTVEKNIVISVSSYFKPTIVDRIDFIRKYIEPFVIGI